MPKFNPDNLNTHELAIEEPEKEAELPFDPERDIDPEHVKIFQKMIEAQISYTNFLTAEKYLGMLKVLGLPHNLSPEDFEKIKVEQKIGLKDDKTLYIETESAADLISLDKILGINNVKDTQADFMQVELDGYMKHGYLRALHIAARMKEAGLNPVISEEEKKKIDENIADMLEGYDTALGMGTLEEVKYLADARIAGFSFNLSADNWKDFRQNIESPEWHPIRALDMYYRLAILVADEVKIPKGGGLELVRHKKEGLTNQTPILPEQKQF